MSSVLPRPAPGIALQIPWLQAAAIGVALLLAAPLAAVAVRAFMPGEDAWVHLMDTVLPDYVATTLALLCGVAVGVMMLGVGAAWLVSFYRFPGRSVMEWALILPLAVPAYVIAYAYTDFLQFSGVVQSALREFTGWRGGEYWFPEIRSLGGAMLVFSLVLYPYVYLLARAAFLEQSSNLVEAGRLLGRSGLGTFFHVALPLARPAIAAGVALALMETLADFGAVSYFGVQTFTTGIYRAWMSMGDPASASRLALVLLLLVAAILAFERWNRGQARYYDTAGRSAARLHALPGWRAAAALALCVIPPLFGFLLPALILVYRVAVEPGTLFTERFVSLAANSFILSGLTAVAAVALALLLAYAGRLSRRPVVRAAGRSAALGYAIPGAVIAVGILVPVGRLDNWIADAVEAAFGIKMGLLLTGSVLALVYAYLVRFLAVALQTIEAGLTKIRPSMEDAARSLGGTPGQVLARVHAPILWPSLVTAGLMVFVEVMKELPATFALRPFNFDTLAVQAYQYASDERLAPAAAASLVIVLVSLLPVALLSRAISGKGRAG